MRVNTTPTAVTGANVRAEMARKGVSQQTVATALGVKQSAVSARLRGVTPFDVNELVVISTLLGVPFERLVEGVAAA